MGSSLRRQKGATLLEALVALLIFAFGMVGIASLMTTAVRYQIGNEARLNVSAAINDLSERIRSNVTSANGYVALLNGTSTTGAGYQLMTSYADQVRETAASPSPDCQKADCSPADLAAYDLVTWKNMLRSSLPGGAGYVTGDVNAGFTVTVMWLDKNAVDKNDAALSNSACTNAVGDQKKPSARFCCPSDASAPDGVRCYTTKVMP